jgi:two-component system sensor histidine kinase BaeS
MSFYWRIALTFVVLVVAVIVGQSVMFGVMMRNAANPPAAPHLRAAAIAAEAGAQMTNDGGEDLGVWLRARHSDDRQRIYLVRADGQVNGNTEAALPDATRRVMLAMLGASPAASLAAIPGGGGPVVTAPVQVDGRLVAMVVLPPPPMGPFSRELGRLLSLPGTLVIFLASVLTALVTFRPARQRLSALEQAAARLGAGDLDARAPDKGGDEIARVARAFNHMAGELSARDQALRASDRQRRQMLADVSHELRTPLTTMRGYLETLRMPEVETNPATRARYLETVERETRRLERIVQDLLDLARLEGGGVTLEPRVFALERVFAAVVARHDREIAARRIAVSVHVDERADQVLADPDRIEQVVDNLVANALRHTPDGQAVELGASGADTAVTVSVANSGPGIPPEHLPHIFDRFYRAGDDRAAATGGSGLGLSIVKAIVERHGGTIAVTSEPGRTVFTVTLPQ